MRALLFALTLAACSSTPGPSTPPTVPSAPVTTHGQIVRTTFESAALGVTKNVVVYLPAGYEAAPAKRWPLVIYLHGLTGRETNWADNANLDEAADRLGLGAIVVMPDGDDSFYADSVTPTDYDACLASGAGLFFPRRPREETCVRTPNYERYITQDLVGWVDRQYRTLGTREGRGIAGLSMGGFGAVMLALRHPDLFAAAASHSGVVAPLFNGPLPYDRSTVQVLDDPRAWGRIVEPMGAWVRGIFGPDLANWQAHDPITLARAMTPGQVALYLDCGTEDEYALQHQAAYLHDVLNDQGIEHVYFLGPGKHDMDFWAARVPESLAFFGAKLAPAR